MSDDFGKELQAAHREQMWKVAGWLIPATLLVIGGAVWGIMYAHSHYYGTDACTVCLDNANDTWDCGTNIGGGWQDSDDNGKTQRACQENRAVEVEKCLTLCEQEGGQ